MPHFKSTLFKSILTIGIVSALAVTAVRAADNVIDVTTAGARGDGTTLNTAAIQKAIDDCGVAGGTILFPAGRYLTGTIQIKSNVTLRLEKDATLLGSTDAADYRNLDPFTDGSGNPLWGHALIVAVDADHVGLEGSGTVDGQSPQLKVKQKPYTMRPFLLRWVRCTHVTVKDVHLYSTGRVRTLNLFQTKDAVIEGGVTIRSRNTGDAQQRRH